MTIKSPATGSRTQEPLGFPGLSKPPTSDNNHFYIQVIDQLMVLLTNYSEKQKHILGNRGNTMENLADAT